MITSDGYAQIITKNVYILTVLGLVLQILRIIDIALVLYMKMFSWNQLKDYKAYL